ncbi:MAG: hypothetical protein QG612_1611 [Pseudomonadota bacterium]|nr:hypothetical protein [Pseudomonadota bacterium]
MIARNPSPSRFERGLTQLAQSMLFGLAAPAILLAVLVGALASVLVGLLAAVGLLPRQPRGAWHQAGIMLRGLLHRTGS